MSPVWHRSDSPAAGSSSPESPKLQFQTPNTPRRDRQTVPLTQDIQFNVTASLMAPRVIMCNINSQINCDTFERFCNCCRNETWLMTLVSESILVRRLCLIKLLLLAHYFNSSPPQELPFFGHLLTGIYLRAAAPSFGISSYPGEPPASCSRWRETLSLEEKKKKSNNFHFKNDHCKTKKIKEFSF